MERDERFPIWVVLLGVAVGGGIAFLLASPRGKTLLRNLPRALTDLTRQSEQVLVLLRDLTGELEQSLKKVESGLEQVNRALEEPSPGETSPSFTPRAA
jgi:gas vesicle protein